MSDRTLVKVRDLVYTELGPVAVHDKLINDITALNSTIQCCYSKSASQHIIIGTDRYQLTMQNPDLCNGFLQLRPLQT